MRRTACGQGTSALPDDKHTDIEPASFTPGTSGSSARNNQGMLLYCGETVCPLAAGKGTVAIRHNKGRPGGTRDRSESGCSLPSSFCRPIGTVSIRPTSAAEPASGRCLTVPGTLGRRTLSAADLRERMEGCYHVDVGVPERAVLHHQLDEFPRIFGQKSRCRRHPRGLG